MPLFLKQGPKEQRHPLGLCLKVFAAKRTQGIPWAFALKIINNDGMLQLMENAMSDDDTPHTETAPVFAPAPEKSASNASSRPIFSKTSADQKALSVKPSQGGASQGGNIRNNPFISPAKMTSPLGLEANNPFVRKKPALKAFGGKKLFSKTDTTMPWRCKRLWRRCQRMSRLVVWQ